MGQVFVKVHSNQGQVVVAACDEAILGRVIRDGNRRVAVTEEFYKGRLLPVRDAVAILREASNFNIIGTDICAGCLQENIIHELGVISFAGIPHAIRFNF